MARALAKQCFFFGAFCALLFAPGFIVPAQPAEPAGSADNPVVVNWSEANDHDLGSPIIRVQDYDRISDSTILLSVVVAPDGTVVSAEATQGPAEFYEQAVRQMLASRFTPFERNGMRVFTRLERQVPIWPLGGRPATAEPFPEIQDMNSLRIRLLNRFACNSCKQYDVEIYGNGTVVYDGIENVIVHGRHVGRTSQESIRRLVESFRAADYFRSFATYPSPRNVMLIHAGGKIITSIAFDQVQKSVEYELEESGIPVTIVELEDWIAAMAGVAKWTEGNAETMGVLHAEGWDFAARTDENRHTLIAAITSAAPDLVLSLIAADMPFDGELRVGYFVPWTAFGNAVRRGNESILQALTNAALARGAPDRDMALWQVAATERTDIIRRLISGGADVNYKDQWGQSVLMQAVQSLSLETVVAVIQGRPDVNARDGDGRNALHASLFNPFASERIPQLTEILRTLLAAGVDVNARDTNGNTPLGASRDLNNQTIKEILRAAGGVE